MVALYTREGWRAEGGGLRSTRLPASNWLLVANAVSFFCRNFDICITQLSGFKGAGMLPTSTSRYQNRHGRQKRLRYIRESSKRVPCTFFAKQEKNKIKEARLGDRGPLSPKRGLHAVDRQYTACEFEIHDPRPTCIPKAHTHTHQLVDTTSVHCPHQKNTYLPCGSKQPCYPTNTPEHTQKTKIPNQPCPQQTEYLESENDATPLGRESMPAPMMFFTKLKTD